MANCNTSMGMALRLSRRPNNPFFGMFKKHHSEKSPASNVAADLGQNATPPPYKIPRMHSWCVPRYHKLMKMREIAQRDDGYRLYEKTPMDRYKYRALYVGTGIYSVYALYHLFHFVVANSP